MPRFLQGTTDHDGDGRMGGSMKENEMTNTEKKVADHATSDAKVTHATTEASKPTTAGSKTYVDGVDAPHAKGEPRDAEDVVVFQQGRTARLGGISKEDAPYDKSNSAHKVWLKGWNSVQG